MPFFCFPVCEDDFKKIRLLGNSFDTQLVSGKTSGADPMKPMDTEGIFVTASELLEYLFCPRFIYFMNCLCISQHEERRYKVQIGREVHTQRETTNIDYLRKKIGCVGKELGVWLSSHSLQYQRYCG